MTRKALIRAFACIVVSLLATLGYVNVTPGTIDQGLVDVI